MAGFSDRAIHCVPLLAAGNPVTPCRRSRDRLRLSINHKEIEMNWDRIEGNWKQFKGNVKQQWGKLTDDQLDVIAGKRDHLAGKIQETYGVSKDEAEKQVAKWQDRQKEIDRPMK
jgi:uncharacterized protein YjbJ (UPF0337 family)